jgi:hypothetical protein
MRGVEEEFTSADNEEDEGKGVEKVGHCGSGRLRTDGFRSCRVIETGSSL